MSSSIPDTVPPHATPEQLRHIINYWRIEANHNYGRWIAAADELNELRKSSFVTAVPSEDYEKLKSENERLRKAGDAMADTLIPWDFEHVKNEDKPLWAFEVSLLDAWLKAKGGQS
jgi:hypothetical protein